MRKFILSVLLFFFVGSLVYSQTWQFDKLLIDFQKPNSNSTGIHGVAVDPDGNIWIAVHRDLLGDTTFTATGDTVVNVPIIILDPSGQPVSFSPLRVLEFDDGTKDTLSTAMGSGSRGISTGINGNILYTFYSEVYEIDYKTGKALKKFVPPVHGSLTEAVQSSDGNIVVGHVGAGHPYYLLDSDLNLIGNAIDTVRYINRSIAISENGKDLYTGSTWNGFGIVHYHSDAPGLVQFTPVDTLGNWHNVTYKDSVYETVNLWASCLDFGPDGYLWAGDLRPDWSGPKGSMWYAFDVTTGKIVDSVGTQIELDSSNTPIWGDPASGGVFSPRGAAWSPDGNTMYLADFDYNVVQIYDRVSVGVEKDGDAIPNSFSLTQNYPNPFNPTTVINFTIPKASNVTLSVYNMLGQEVATLVNEQKPAGVYKATFDASQLASGVYVYTLKAGNFIASKKMMLMK